MFKGQLGDLTLVGDHLDISYRDPEIWPTLTPHGSIRSFAFEFGDEQAGPQMQLGLITPMDTEKLDWKHSIDPVHHHGSDQFRVVSGGTWILANKPMPTGAFSYQEAGWVYQEHPDESAGVPTWTALVMGDRRGMVSTLFFQEDNDTVFQAGDAFGQPIADGSAYPHPAGDKGIAAVITTEGPCKRGYFYVEPDELPVGQSVSGIIGDPKAGPLIHSLKGGKGEMLVPDAKSETEVVIIVAQGECVINGKRYEAGDIRVQAPGHIFSMSAGPAGVEVVLVVGDRRAPIIPTGDEGRDWMYVGPTLVEALEPVPGGTWRPLKKSVEPALG